MIRTKDKKVIIVVFRGTELTNLANWLTDAVAKQCDFHENQPQGTRIRVHKGFKDNFDSVWFGQKGILAHLLAPEKMREDYDYSKDRANQLIPSEQAMLEAVYICGHSLGGAMAFLAGLYLGDKFAASVFQKVKGVYTYGSPMVVDDRDRQLCETLCGTVTFRHVYYNDIVPHLPPLSTGGFDHVGPEYRYHPVTNWNKRKGGFGFKPDRSTQVALIVPSALAGVVDGVLDNINWFSFLRGEDRDWPIIGMFSRGYLKMPWSFLDHSPVGYVSSLRKLATGPPYDQSLDP
jgi:Lipase (class 3)